MTDVPDQVLTVLPLLQSHRAVKAIVGHPDVLKGGITRVELDILVQLPSRSRRRGVSRTGVNAIERVYLDFPTTFPLRAPVPKLRKDFNRNLAHIHPGRLEGCVRPCIYDGNLDDLLHQGSFTDAILNQLVDWLRKAAGGHLIDPSQGWEPVRRDDLEGSLIFSLADVRSEVKRDAGNTLFACRYFVKGSAFFGCMDTKSSFNRADEVVKLLGEKKEKENVILGRTVAALVWSQEKHRVDRYLPESVMNLGELIGRAGEYGCAQGLQYRLREILRETGVYRAEFNQVLRIPVLLTARRPFHLIGDTSSLEVLPYLVMCQADGKGELDLGSTVLPLGHLDDVSPKLFQKISGTPIAQKVGPIVQLGCGSLGSKIALHLARAGHSSFRLVDKGYLRPHNLARHGLLTDMLYEEKSVALKKAIENLGGTAENVTDNVVERISQGMTLAPRKSRLIVDSTASLAVREALAVIPSSELAGRLMHTCLYGGGELGIIGIEGPSRNPRIDDLIVKLFDMSIESSKIASFIQQGGDRTSRQPIGQGCGSATMVMSDARVSMFAAGMAERANQLLTTGTPGTGELLLGFVELPGLGVSWQAVAVPPVLSVRSHRDRKWDIRLFENVAKLIGQQATQTGDVETGGVLVGHVSWARRCLTISRTLPAPPDSRQSQNCFVLGTAGLREAVKDLQRKSAGLLTYVGTWHTHPKGGGPSAKDRETLERLASLRLGVPSIMLVWSPTEYCALIDEGNP